jgi:hypothetical protein
MELAHCAENAVAGSGYGTNLAVEARLCTDPARGVGLYALRRIQAKEVVFTERPVVAVRDVFGAAYEEAGESGRRCCATCLASLVPNPWGNAVPLADERWPQLTASACPGGCGELYCAGKWRCVRTIALRPQTVSGPQHAKPLAAPGGLGQG